MNTDTATITVDWTGAARVAERLGARSRDLVASRDIDAARTWALSMAEACACQGVSSSNSLRAASYLELAVLMGDAARNEREDEADEPARLDGDNHDDAADERQERSTP